MQKSSLHKTSFCFRASLCFGLVCSFPVLCIASPPSGNANRHNRNENFRYSYAQTSKPVHPYNRRPASFSRQSEPLQQNRPQAIQDLFTNMQTKIDYPNEFNVEEDRQLQKWLDDINQRLLEHKANIRYGPINYSRTIYLLGKFFQKWGNGRNLSPLKSTLEKYWRDKPDFMEHWYFNSRNLFDYYNEQDFSNSIYGLGLLGMQGMKPDKEWLDAWCEASEGRLEYFHEQHFSNSIHGLGKLSMQGMPPPQAWLDAWCGASEGKLEDFTNQGLSNSIYGLGLLSMQRMTLPQAWLDAWCGASEKILKKLKFPEFTNQGLSNSIYGLGLLSMQRMTLPQAWLDVWCGASEGKLKDFTNQHFSNSIYGLGKLSMQGMPLPEAWLDAWCGASEKILKKLKFPEFTNQGLSNSIYSLGLLSMPLPQAWLDVWCGASEGKLKDFKEQELSNSIHGLGKLSMQRMTLPQAWLDVWCGASEGKLKDFKEQELSNSIHGLGKLSMQGMTLPQAWLDAWCGASEGKLEDFNEQELSNSIYSLGLLGKLGMKFTKGQREGLLKGWLASWCKASEGKLKDFKEQAFSNSIYGLGLLGMKFTKGQLEGLLKEWLASWCGASQGKLEDFNEQELSNSIYGLGFLGKLGMKPTKVWLDAWFKASEGKLEDFKEQHFSNSIYGLGLLSMQGMKPTQKWLDAWCKASEGKLKDFNEQAFSNSIYGLGLLSMQGMKPTKAWLDAWCGASEGKFKDFTNQHFSNSIYGLGKLGMKGMKPTQKWLDAWFEASEGKLEDFNEQELNMSIYGLGKLGIQGMTSPQAWLDAWFKASEGKFKDFNLFSRRGFRMRRLGFEFLGKAVPDRIHQAPQTSPVAGPQAGDLEPNISKELLLVELDNIIATLELEDEEYNWHPAVPHPEDRPKKVPFARRDLDLREYEENRWFIKSSKALIISGLLTPEDIIDILHKTVTRLYRLPPTDWLDIAINRYPSWEGFKLSEESERKFEDTFSDMYKLMTSPSASYHLGQTDVMDVLGGMIELEDHLLKGQRLRRAYSDHDEQRMDVLNKYKHKELTWEERDRWETKYMSVIDTGVLPPAYGCLSIYALTKKERSAITDFSDFTRPVSYLDSFQGDVTEISAKRVMETLQYFTKIWSEHFTGSGCWSNITVADPTWKKIAEKYGIDKKANAIKEKARLENVQAQEKTKKLTKERQQAAGDVRKEKKWFQDSKEWIRSGVHMSQISSNLCEVLQKFSSRPPADWLEIAIHHPAWEKVGFMEVNMGMILQAFAKFYASICSVSDNDMGIDVRLGVIELEDYLKNRTRGTKLERAYKNNEYKGSEILQKHRAQALTWEERDKWEAKYRSVIDKNVLPPEYKCLSFDALMQNEATSFEEFIAAAKAHYALKELEEGAGVSHTIHAFNIFAKKFSKEKNNAHVNALWKKLELACKQREEVLTSYKQNKMEYATQKWTSNSPEELLTWLKKIPNCLYRLSLKPDGQSFEAWLKADEEEHKWFKASEELLGRCDRDQLSTVLYTVFSQFRSIPPKDWLITFIDLYNSKLSSPAELNNQKLLQAFKKFYTSIRSVPDSDMGIDVRLDLIKLEDALKNGREEAWANTFESSQYIGYEILRKHKFKSLTWEDRDKWEEKYRSVIEKGILPPEYECLSFNALMKKWKTFQGSTQFTKLKNAVEAHLYLKDPCKRTKENMQITIDQLEVLGKYGFYDCDKDIIDKFLNKLKMKLNPYKEKAVDNKGNNMYIYHERADNSAQELLEQFKRMSNDFALTVQEANEWCETSKESIQNGALNLHPKTLSDILYTILMDLFPNSFPIWLPPQDWLGVVINDDQWEGFSPKEESKAKLLQAFEKFYASIRSVPDSDMGIDVRLGIIELEHYLKKGGKLERAYKNNKYKGSEILKKHRAKELTWAERDKWEETYRSVIEKGILPLEYECLSFNALMKQKGKSEVDMFDISDAAFAHCVLQGPVTKKGADPISKAMKFFENIITKCGDDNYLCELNYKIGDNGDNKECKDANGKCDEYHEYDEYEGEAGENSLCDDKELEGVG